MEIKINDEIANDPKHVLSNGDIVTIVGKDRDLSDKFVVVTLKSDNGAFHMPKVNMPDKIEIPSVTIDFNKIKNSASELLGKAKGLTKDDVKAKADDLAKTYQEKMNEAAEAVKKQISKYVPTVVLVDLYSADVLNLNKLYVKLGGSEVVDLYMASVKKHVSFASALVNGIGDLDGINDLGDDTIRVIGRFAKDHDETDHSDDKEHQGAFDELVNKLLDADVKSAKKDEKKEEKPAGDPKEEKKSDSDWDGDELDIKGLADLLKDIGAIGNKD